MGDIKIGKSKTANVYFEGKKVTEFEVESFDPENLEASVNKGKLKLTVKDKKVDECKVQIKVGETAQNFWFRLK